MPLTRDEIRSLEVAAEFAQQGMWDSVEDQCMLARQIAAAERHTPEARSADAARKRRERKTKQTSAERKVRDRLQKKRRYAADPEYRSRKIAAARSRRFWKKIAASASAVRSGPDWMKAGITLNPDMFETYPPKGEL